MGRFADALARPGLTAIAEVKRRSPSAGDLRPDADPAAIAAAYERAGAAAVSILVDERFGGTWNDLRAARGAAALPLLAKGFFTSTEDLRTAREAGADAALLLMRDLDDGEVTRLLAAASDLRLETLVEAHDARELDRAVALGAPVIGINARDLSTFEIDRTEQLRLVASSPRDRVVIAESGIESRAQGAAAELAGADAILVGSTLMRAPDPAGEARGAGVAPAREGLRAHARGGRCRCGRGGGGHGRIRARRRESTARARDPSRAGHRPRGRRRRRRS